jgi:hypothetical protein
MTPDDDYREGSAIAQYLADQGYPEWADRIMDAMRAAATGGEFVGGLGMALKAVLESDVPLSPGMRSRAQALRVRLRKKWGRGAAF